MKKLLTKRNIITCIAIIAAFFIGGTIGSSVTKDDFRKRGIVLNSNKNIQPAATNKVEKSKEESKKEPTIVNVATAQKSGDWEIKVLEAKESTEVNAGHGKSVKTNDKFIILKLELKNTASSKIQYSNNDFILLNSNKSKYESHMDSAQQLNSDEKIYKKNTNFVGVYDDINPGTTKNTYVSFEVPKDTSIDDFLFVNAKGTNGDLVGYKLK